MGRFALQKDHNHDATTFHHTFFYPHNFPDGIPNLGNIAPENMDVAAHPLPQVLVDAYQRIRDRFGPEAVPPPNGERRKAVDFEP